MTPAFSVPGCLWSWWNAVILGTHPQFPFPETASRTIADTLEEGLIKLDGSAGTSRRYAKHMSF